MLAATADCLAGLQARVNLSEAVMQQILDMRATNLQQLGSLMRQRISLERSYASLSRASTHSDASKHAEKLLTVRPCSQPAPCCSSRWQPCRRLHIAGGPAAACRGCSSQLVTRHCCLQAATAVQQITESLRQEQRLLVQRLAMKAQSLLTPHQASSHSAPLWPAER